MGSVTATQIALFRRNFAREADSTENIFEMSISHCKPTEDGAPWVYATDGAGSYFEGRRPSTICPIAREIYDDRRSRHVASLVFGNDAWGDLTGLGRSEFSQRTEPQGTLEMREPT
jgi:hypothetical protein